MVRRSGLEPLLCRLSGDCFNQLNYPRIFCLVSNHLLNKTCKMSTYILTVPSQSTLKDSLCDFITRFLLVGFVAKHHQELNLLVMRIELICTHGIPLYPHSFTGFSVPVHQTPEVGYDPTTFALTGRCTTYCATLEYKRL